MLHTRRRRRNVGIGGYAPILSWNFLSGVAPNNITFSRASAGMAANNAGVWSSFASGVPRITNKGFLIEEAATNVVPNSTCQGAIIGNTTIPCITWTSQLGGITTGLTSQVTDVGTENGLPYVDIRVQGTVGTGGTWNIDPMPTNVNAAVQGQVWTGSMFMSLRAGAWPSAGMNQVNLQIIERNSGGSQIAINNFNIGSLVTGQTLTRVGFTQTLGNALTAFCQFAFRPTVTAAEVVDFTVRLAQPQLELNAFATSPIQTTSAAATRALDLAQVTGLLIPKPFTLITRGQPQITGVAVNNRFAQLNDAVSGVFNNQLNSASFKASLFSTGGTTSDFGNVITQGASQTLASSLFANGSARASAGGATAGAMTGTSTFATAVTLTLGGSGGAGRQLGGYLERTALYGTTFTDAQLQAASAA